MEMVRHENELVDEETAFAAIDLKNVEEQLRHFWFFEEGMASVCDGSDENVRIS